MVYILIVYLKSEMRFLLENTSYSKEEILRWHAGFLVIKNLSLNLRGALVCSFKSYALKSFFQKDCPSGELDKKQFTNVFKAFYPQGKAEKFSHQIFNVFDSDRSG
jgi:hypothetical protein